MEDKRYMQAASELNLLALGQSAGVVYWKPAGFKLYNNLKKFIQHHYEALGYQEVKSPSMVVSDVFEQSGHQEKYKENMFFVEDGEYALRPMSCPNHMLIYQSQKHSYRNLPFKLFEFGEVFRNEASGSLQLLFRQRQFCQDDSHVFVNEDKLQNSLIDYLKMSKKVYQELGFKHIKYAISLRPEKRFGDDKLWDKAEDALEKACQSEGLEYELLPGEGAFYGPKIEVQVQDKLGRFWQLGTLQVDYVLPERFNLNFINEKNEAVRPIMLHQAVLGSLERMVGVLLEIFGVDLPEFLHPYEKVVVAISEKSHDYAHALGQKLNALVDNSDDPLGKKLEFWRAKGVPNIYVVGEKEGKYYAENNIFKAVLNKGQNKEVIEINN